MLIGKELFFSACCGKPLLSAAFSLMTTQTSDSSKKQIEDTAYSSQEIRALKRKHKLQRE
jgi:hypothetical protein